MKQPVNEVVEHKFYQNESIWCGMTLNQLGIFMTFGIIIL